MPGLPAREFAGLDRFERIAALGMASMHPGGSGATRVLAAWAGIGSATKVLDVGCGVGKTASYLTRRYQADVTGLDRSPAMIARARGRWPGLRFLEGDAYALPFEDGRFEVVFAESVTLFLERDRVLPEFRRVLAAGGRVADVVMTCRDPVPAEVLDRFETLEGVRMAPLSPGEWLEAYARAGLEIVRSDFHASISDGATLWTFLGDNGVGGLQAVARMAGMWLADRDFRGYVRDGTATWREHRHRFGFGLILARRP